ncbi:hypothetical protein [Saccharomonospora sp.]|uniref:hypothetical protein n=1 Tax=Saccharomonospora sp. TaxID=33913 RepID=UPI00260339B7|nr:hypothetical protein [Saccharomonospora sp.]
MRISPTAFSRVARRALATIAATAVVGGMTVLTAGTAAAATAVADNCTGAVGGRVGDMVALDGASVSELVRAGAEEARTIVVVHHLTIWPNHLARKISDTQVEVGTVPDAPTSSISGEAIGAAVRQALEGKAGLGALPSTQRTTLDSIAETVSAACQLTVEATNHTQRSTQPKPSSEPTPDSPDRSDENSAGTHPHSGDADADGRDGGFQNTGEAMAKRRDYDGIPAAEAPGAGISVPEDLQYAPSSGVPGEPLTPSYGSLGDEDSGNSAHGSDLRNAGDADALAVQDRQQAVQLPMLLAVVALAAVTAGLVRTWALRRAS